jgi:hypothetical protein
MAPHCWVCFQELTDDVLLGRKPHPCKEVELGEPGPEVYPTADTVDLPLPRPTSQPTEQEDKRATRKAAISKLLSLVKNSARKPISPPPGLPPPGTIRRTTTITQHTEQLGNSNNPNITRPRAPLFGQRRFRHRRHLSTLGGANRARLPAIPEVESESDKEAEPEPEPEKTPKVKPSERLPIPPLTPWRRLLLTQDYSDKEEDIGTIINRLDDAVAASPELWTSGFVDQIDGRPSPTLEYFRRIHEYHQQRIANWAPSSFPYFFARLGAKQYEW